MSTKIPKQEVEPLLLDGRALAKMVDLSPRWVELNRERIIGHCKVGSRHKFHRATIMAAIENGNNIVADN
ncbi:MAG: hypothetical protein LBC59_09330 [Chitinispirillales bacterium]|jgi:hypothetical protein|nr:hypothetical protein [Chitinispirillales bacterium]